MRAHRVGLGALVTGSIRRARGFIKRGMLAMSLLWSVLFGSVGLGFFVYGKKQRAVVPLVCGLTLMVFPYFVSSTILLVILGSALVALPYFFRF
jgi:hypothetical protein